ncbi:DUF559 domain-containing protein [Nitrobacter sp.]|uniref:DUF559 domain-containing protein n=1 Tax=unclassified Nitrobacter TaxID=2620411 RepID=UPI000E2F7BE7|nr:DUF559 domain-containing protein [Nitrobacter sp.]MCV0386236.1 DUF559 domain-containing protein [Nitrobacter sp.]
MECGFRILRFWNNDILLKTSAVVEEIRASVSPPSPGFAPAGTQPPSPTRGEGKTRSE